jgi:hypothetical protein
MSKYGMVYTSASANTMRVLYATMLIQILTLFRYLIFNKKFYRISKLIC